MMGARNPDPSDWYMLRSLKQRMLMPPRTANKPGVKPNRVDLEDMARRWRMERHIT